MNMLLRFVALVMAFGLAFGCAKYPESGSGTYTKRLIFYMKVDGKLRTGLEADSGGLPYVYIIALRVSKDATPTDAGPEPVVTPGGNGFVAGNCTHYILWNPLVSPSYQIWQFNDTTMNQSYQTGVPINYTTVAAGGNELRCEIDMSQLVASTDVGLYQSVQVNFLTMNNTSTSGSGRLWDALGDSRVLSQINSYVTARLNASQTYSNTSTGNIEPKGDVTDPDLDIVDWSVEVRLP